MKNHILCVGILLVAVAGTYYVGKSSGCGVIGGISSEQWTLRTAMRKLWSDHVWWTRDYLITAISDMPDVEVATNRLLKNQEDIGAAIVPYYGQDSGDALTKLLKEHILISADVVKAAKENNDKNLKEADARWHVNADEIATFLSNANPDNWTYKDMKHMMYEHLRLTTQEATARLKKDWQTDMETFEKVFDEIMMMADDLTTGIVKQFPDKF
jgi:hypothetical protein